ncbi:MAG TPA: hydrogenase 3 maturation endopeptidase HyCI [Anaerolineales bacterium]
MLNSSWQECLKVQLQKLTAADGRPRLAFMGIGHELCGDDAVGMRIAGLLRPLLGRDERCLVLEAGPAPENFTGVLRRFQPDLVVLLDSALMDEAPGGVRWLDWQETESLSASTHTLPLHLLVSYLTAELGCATGLIGIQPGQTFADAPLTPSVQSAAEVVAGFLADSVKLQGRTLETN